MFVTTAMVGWNCKKLALNSQASTTNVSCPPTRVLPPM